jgi:hypothetical protein
VFFDNLSALINRFERLIEPEGVVTKAGEFWEEVIEANHVLNGISWDAVESGREVGHVRDRHHIARHNRLDIIENGLLDQVFPMFLRVSEFNKWRTGGE